MNLNTQIEQIEIIKKDIHSKVYDHNLATNNKFQMINECLIEKFEDYDKIINRFQESILFENTKFTDYISDQLETSHINTKKLLEYMNSDLALLKDKTSNLDSMVKTSRNEFFNNLNEIEEFFSKKYEYLFRTIHNTNSNCINNSGSGVMSPSLSQTVKDKIK